MKKLAAVLAIALVAVTFVSQSAFAEHRYHRPNVGAQIAGAALGALAATVLMNAGSNYPQMQGYPVPVYPVPAYLVYPASQICRQYVQQGGYSIYHCTPY